MPEIEVIAEQWPEQIAFVPSTPAGDPAPATEARADLDVLVGLPFHLTGELLDEMPNVRLIHILGHGVDPLFAPELLGRIRERGITVARTGCASTAAAEYAIMAMVTLARRITPMHYDVLANGGWSLERKVRRMEGGLGGELAGKRLLIVGYGGIGRELAPRAKAFGMEVTVLRRHPASERSGPSVDRFAGMGDLDRELSRTDHLVLAVPLTEETNGVIDAARVSLLRPATCVVNLARGEVVDEAALLRALEAGWIGGLALDVWRHEVDPTVPLPGSEWLARNLLATPHISGLTVEARLRSLETIGESLRRFLRGEKLAHVVDLELGY
ncbi:NAD(P)-dependent oxidoreductase [Nitriliruptor alkaliphilus]|uniref:NAD(P)-dependent oxidoreductase n=1 Tax=Nitriliruptor alkaliphilus TaxID=427918 RepID=UPI001B80CFD9|nr:NAD(P)-dependent oxidoreductase [Nitriliruptor alkaliphilus]